MAGSGIFKSYKRADAILQEPGYTQAYVNILTDFTTLQEPAALTEDSVTGDNKIITATHVWAAGLGPMSVYINNKSLEAPAETVGDPSSLKLKYTLKMFIKGDGPVSQDWVESLLNEQWIAFIKDQCQGGEMLQFGCDCYPGEVQKASFTSGTLNSGAKGYSFEVDFYCRFFYRGGDLTPRA